MHELRQSVLSPKTPPITDIRVAIIVGSIQLLLRIIRSKNPNKIDF